jgi:hypothetical protein
MAQKLIARRPRRDEVGAGEILVGLAWTVFYIALIASDWVRDELMLVAERGLPSLF